MFEPGQRRERIASALPHILGRDHPAFGGKPHECIVNQCNPAAAPWFHPARLGPVKDDLAVPEFASLPESQLERCSRTRLRAIAWNNGSSSEAVLMEK
jgi:hypothetical protein